MEKDITLEKREVKTNTIELIANEMYDKMTTLSNKRGERLGIKGGANIEEPIRNYDIFDLDDNGNLTFTYENKVKGLGNINEGLMPPSKIIKE